MGANGFVWVRWGAGGMGEPKSNACAYKNGRAGPNLGSTTGESSPNIMLFSVWGIWLCMGVGECIWVLMGVLEVGYTGATKNNRKRNVNGRVIVIL